MIFFLHSVDHACLTPYFLAPGLRDRTLNIHILKWASLVTQTVKNLPETQETGLIPELGRSPGGGHGNLPWAEFLTLAGTLLMAAIHSSILAWRIPWREEPAGLQSTG